MREKVYLDDVIKAISGDGPPEPRYPLWYIEKIKNLKPVEEHKVNKSKIKMNYVALIGLKSEVDEDDPGILKFEDIQKNVKEGITKELERFFKDELADGKSEVSVIQLQADVWRE